MEFNAFAASMRQAGFDQILERAWEAGTVLEEHSHAFHARALLVSGEMWLTVGGETRHLRAGDTFELAPHQPHAERYGASGAVYWVARRS